MTWTSSILVIVLIVVTIIILAWLLAAYFQLSQLANNVEQKKTAVASAARQRHGLANQIKALTHQKLGGDAETLLQKTDKELFVEDIVLIEVDTNTSVTTASNIAAQDVEIGGNPEYRALTQQIQDTMAGMVQNREDYDDNARTYNIARSMVLRQTVAHIFKFEEAPYFPIDVLLRTLPDQTPLPLA